MNAPEWLMLWYLRLNGYFAIPNFVVHGKKGALTDVDVMAVRFPHSIENGLVDDPDLKIPADRIDLVLAEAKRQQIDDLNGPWKSRGNGRLDYVLRRAGLFEASEVKTIADAVYGSRRAETPTVSVRILCFADHISPALEASGVVPVNWGSVLNFIHNRFHDNQTLKADHDAWDEFGRFLWDTVESVVPKSQDFFSRWESRSSGASPIVSLGHH